MYNQGGNQGGQCGGGEWESGKRVAEEGEEQGDGDP